jgi:hypothetical protein
MVPLPPPHYDPETRGWMKASTFTDAPDSDAARPLALPIAEPACRRAFIGPALGMSRGAGEQ